MSIRLAGLPPGVQAERICHGNLVGEEEFELHGTAICQGGRVASSAVVVTPKEGYEFVKQPNGNFEAKKK